MNGLMPGIAPRPVLLIAGGLGAPDEILANRVYRDAGGPTTQLWEISDAWAPAALAHPPRRIRATHDRIPRPGPRARRDSVTLAARSTGLARREAGAIALRENQQRARWAARYRVCLDATDR